MEFGPILRSLARNKTGAVLIALQIAFTMTVVVNAYFIIGDRQARMQRPSGVAEETLFHLGSAGYTTNYDAVGSLAQDLQLLRSTPGVVDAVAVNQIPLDSSGWSSGAKTAPGNEHQSVPTAMYMGDHRTVATFGLKLVAGRDFTEADVRDRVPNMRGWPDKLMVTQALAAQLWPDEAPQAVLGRSVYIGDEAPATVIAVIEKLQAPWSGWSQVEQSVLVPEKLLWPSVNYMVRTEPGQRDALMPLVEEALATSNTQRIVSAPESMDDTRKRSYALDAGVSRILTVVMVLLVAITALGVIGLVSFSVRRRVKQIGTRRALGATRADIRRYFLLENFIITSVGLVMGAALTVGFNMWTVSALGFPKIDLAYVAGGMLLLWVVGLLAALGPAQRACAIAPAVATRTV